MRIVVLDFETYWNSKDGYTLSKVGPLEYIRDPRFYVQCVALRVNKGNTYLFQGDDIGKALKAYNLEDPCTITVAHNGSGFDFLVLSEHFGIHPAFMVDTISMMHWCGLSRVISCSHKALTDQLKHGVKQAGTVVSDGKRTAEEFTPEEWQFFCEYCIDDTLQCSENFYSMLPYMTEDALKTMNITAKMVTEPGFYPDLASIESYIKSIDAQSEQARLELCKFLHFDNVDDMLKALRSRTRFPTLLEALGVKCPMKWSERSQKEIPAIAKSDLEFTALLKHSDPKVRTLVSARLEQNTSIELSRAKSLLKFVGKPIPIMLSAYKAHTGRYAAGNEGKSDGLNFQNLSKRDPNKLALRKSLRVPDGMKVIACDSSQVEARILAWVAGQDDLVQQFRDKQDPYAEMASRVYHVPAEDIHKGAKDNDHPQHNLYKKYRNVGKTAVLQLGYGSSIDKFAETLLRSKISLAEDLSSHYDQSAQVVQTYRAVNHRIKAFWSEAEHVLQVINFNKTSLGKLGVFGRDGIFEYGIAYVPCTEIKSAYIKLPNGYVLWYPNLRIYHHKGHLLDGKLVYDKLVHGQVTPTQIYGGKCVENLCQALAFHMLTWQACRMSDAGISLKGNIHDCWFTVVPTAKVEETKSLMEKIMSSVPSWLTGFPVGCEAEVGDDFTVV